MESFRPTRFRHGSDSGLSSSSNDTLSSKDFRFEAKEVGVGPFIIEKIKKLEKIAENLKRAKEEFFKKYVDVNDQLEQIYCTATARREELKTQLMKISVAQVSHWNRQLKVCEEAEDWLKNVKMDFPPSDEVLQETSSMYARDIGFINSPEILIDDNSLSEQNDFENIGKEIGPGAVQHNYARKIEPKFCIGSKGQNIGEFNQPWGVCSDATGRILVADCGNNRIQVFNERGKFLFKFGRFGFNAREFHKPVGITVDKKSRIIVTDQNNHRVQVFDCHGGFVFMFGRRGCKPGQFQFPWDVDTNSEGDIAVSDTKNQRVQLFTKNGMFISEFSLERHTEGMILSSCPCGVAFKPDGSLLVTDAQQEIVLKIDGDFVSSTKIENVQFCFPQGVACSSSGKFVVASGQHSTIQVFDDQEKLEGVFGVQGNHRVELEHPQGVCFHPNGSIIVTDFGNNRVQVF